jgi:hypothetical protein
MWTSSSPSTRACFKVEAPQAERRPQCRRDHSGNATGRVCDDDGLPRRGRLLRVGRTTQPRFRRSRSERREPSYLLARSGHRRSPDASADAVDEGEFRPTVRWSAGPGDLHPLTVGVDRRHEVQHGGVAYPRHHDVAQFDPVCVDQLDGHPAATRNHRLHGFSEGPETPRETEPQLPHHQPEHERRLWNGRAVDLPGRQLYCESWCRGSAS